MYYFFHNRKQTSVRIVFRLKKKQKTFFTHFDCDYVGNKLCVCLIKQWNPQKGGRKKDQFSLIFVVFRVRGGGSRRLVRSGDCFRECGCNDPRFVQCGQHGSVYT